MCHPRAGQPEAWSTPIGDAARRSGHHNKNESIPKVLDKFSKGPNQSNKAIPQGKMPKRALQSQRRPAGLPLQ